MLFCRILKRLFYLFYLRFIESYRINRQVGFFFSFACFFRLISILLASVNPLKNDPMDNILFWLVPVASVLALCFAYYFHKQMMKESEGTPQMIKIAAAVRKGAMSYLKQQYKIVGWVFLGLVILFSIMAYILSFNDFIYAVIVVPVLPARPSFAFSRLAITAFLSELAVTNLIDASTLGNVVLAGKCPSLIY